MYLERIWFHLKLGFDFGKKRILKTLNKKYLKQFFFDWIKQLNG